MVSGLGFRVSGFGLTFSGFGFRVSGFGSPVSGLGFRISNFWSRVSDFGSMSTESPQRRRFLTGVPGPGNTCG